MDYQNDYAQTNNDGCLDWDSEIQQEDSYVLIPEGDYPFTIQKVERQRFTPKPNSNSKIPACNMAVVTFLVGGETLTDNFKLHSKMEWKLSAFYAAIGMKQKGEKVRMNWPGVVGRTGFCRIVIDKYTKNNGSEGESNKIDKFYAPWDSEYPELQQRFGGAQQPAPQTWQQPAPQQTTMSGYQTNAPAWQAGKF